MDYIKGAAGVGTLLLALAILLDKLWSGRRSFHNSNSVNIASKQLDSAASASDSADSNPLPLPIGENDSRQLDYVPSASDSADSNPLPLPIGENASRQLDSVASASDSADYNPLPLPIGEYEVFLNFRGPDTRNQITDILYRFFVNLKIRTFKDDDELRKGEGIWPGLVKAIKQSKIYVPIFSENYAYSKWCLKELAVIVEHQERNQGCIILPIFYMVDPGDIRNQSGTYKYAFEEHKNNFDEETIQAWRDALKKVGEMKGWHVKSSDEQGAIADLATGIVCSHLSKSNNVLETDKLIGIDDHIEAVKERIALDSPCMAIVGIYGMGGIGKTTIAKAVYNKVFPQFTGCSFAEDVREMLQQKDGAIILQKHIISGILGMKRFAECIASSSEGIRILQDRLSGIKFLIVLDDVDEKFKFKNILGDIKKFVPGSRFIITSRNIKVLSTLTDDCKLYRVREMNPHHSLQLFCNHAFKQDSPPSSHETLSKDIVSVAAGLPLALKVIGSDLLQEEVVIWEDKLRLLQEIPEEEVVQRLRISYDSLTYEAKQIFLDIACFFIGEDRVLPSYMWSDCGYFPITSINILKQRSLIEIGSDYPYKKDVGNLKNVFRMHDQLRAMGREIVRQDSIEHQMTGSRIWSEKKALDILLHKKGTKRVKGIRLHLNSLEESIGEFSQECLNISQECFMNLSELIYLEIKARMLIDCYVPNLRWLRLLMTSGECVPKLSVENLVILELLSSQIDELGALRHIKMATKLKVLKLWGYGLCEFPEFPGGLEILYGSHLNGNDLDIGNLGNLKVLHLNYCGVTEIKGMTPSENIKGRHLFPSSLTTIFLKSCWQLKWLPSLEKLENLTDLSIKGCPHVKEIVGLGGLKALETLVIDMRDVHNLNGLGSLHSLKSLSLNGCYALSGLPSMASLSKLLHLHISDCHSLTEIEGLGGLKSLETLTIHDAWCLTRLLSFDILLSLNKLKGLKIRGCPLLTLLPFNGLDDGRLSEASVVDSLRELEISATRLVLQIFCQMIRLFMFPSLKELTLNAEKIGNNAHTELRLVGLELMEELVELKLCDLASLTSLPSLAKLGSLKRLNVKNAPFLLEIEGLESMEELVELKLCDLASLRRLPSLVKLGSLKRLNVTNVPYLPEIEGLESMEVLVELKLYDLASLRRLPSLSKLGNLQWLTIEDAPNLLQIEGLAGLKSLEELHLTKCTALERLPADQLSGLEHLKSLDITGCTNLIDLIDLRVLEPRVRIYGPD